MQVVLADDSTLVCSLSHDLLAAVDEGGEMAPIGAERLGMGNALRVADGPYAAVRR